MEEDVLNALQSRSAFLPGGRDRDNNLLLVIPVPFELHPWTKPYLETSIKYILSSLRSTCGANLSTLIVIRPDAFWDKQRVENCARINKTGEPIIISKSRLSKYFDMSELPDELGGTLAYSHEQWLHNRMRVEEFKKAYDRTVNDLENLHIALLDSKSLRANETEQALKTCAALNGDAQRLVYSVIETVCGEGDSEVANWLEMQCLDTYGRYAELLHKIENSSVPRDTFMHKDLMSKKDFMDFVCRSFATRLERRRNILITALRFFRLVSEYFDKTSEVFETMIMRNRLDDFEMAPMNLQKLKESQQELETVEKELIREGEKLSDMLAMPVKDALGCDVGIDYSEDIVNIRDILDASIARRNIFIDSVELQKLTLEQVALIHSYETDAAVAVKWMEDLYSVMIKLHSHVGSNMYEIQTQKEELQAFQETAKSIYGYGCQLLEASLTLRQSCKFDVSTNAAMLVQLQRAWSNLQTVSQEQMTRLRVSAVFHRSVEDHCQKLKELRTAVETTSDIDDPDRRRARLRKYLACRERLLVEVGRMVRKTLIADLGKITWSPNLDFVKSPDLMDALESIKRMLNEVEKRQTEVASAWIELEASMEIARELGALEEGVASVINWILTTAESLLNAQKKIGYDVQTSEELRKKHDQLEMQCLDTYGRYAELLHKIENSSVPRDTFMHKDLMSKKDFMDFVCRSFATRLERRRNILITALRFFRLVSEYFDKTSEVFETMIMRNRLDDFEMAPMNLQKLKESQQELETVEKELIREGEKLSDMLAMPVKDALGCDVGIDYSEDIVNIRDILDASIARRNIFIDSVELQKLTLEQVALIHSYETDAAVAVKWMEDLYSVMIKLHSHVGSNMYEIQTQKEELQAFQETAKSIYGYGCQLLEASLTLRQSCKFDVSTNAAMLVQLQRAWSNLQTVSQEQMTRLRVSAVFHRSVEDHCQKLKELRTAVETTSDIDDPDRRRARLRKYLACRERLLVEVGRMVRLGRLLRTRLKEAFILDDKADGVSSSGENTNTVMASDNAIACEAISEKLNTVATVAEALDGVLRDTQHGLEVIETTVAEKKGENGVEVRLELKPKVIKSSTEDESFITASDCTWTAQSRSSSYHTASECRASPWWDSEKNSLDIADVSDIEADIPSHKLHGLSSNSASFDESERSFLSPANASPLYPAEQSDSDDTRKKPMCRGRNSPDSEVLLTDGKPALPRRKDADGVEKVRSEANPNDFLTWNGYYQSFITKQTIKGCF
uniref:Putative sec14 domain and spectrin repeat-containing protein 1 n=1 Tax=Lutzomyia longipalpis TaxID=7200 RepID=A0A1B0CIV5_LUTLO